MTRAVVLDIGGVVFIPKTFHPLAKEYAKIMIRKEDEVYETFVKYWHMWKLEKIKESEFFENLMKDLGVKADKDRLREIMYSFPELDMEIVSLIKRLKNGYEIFSLTNHAREFFDFLDRKHGLNGMFDRIFKSYETGLAKPDPRFFEYMLKETGMKPEECVFVDDREENVETARKLGMRAILYENAKILETELRKIGLIF
jgi:epoxide hydrolase-like predicted phosphatase